MPPMPKNPPDKARSSGGAPDSKQPPAPAASARTKDLAIFLMIVSLAFVLRQVYVLELSHSPLFDQPQMDELYHDQWARAIVADRVFVDGPYFRAPLYPWFLAAVYKLCGPGYLAPRIAQMLLGLGNRDIHVTVSATYLLR